MPACMALPVVEARPGPALLLALLAVVANVDLDVVVVATAAVLLPPAVIAAVSVLVVCSFCI
jgi:hypothetical protein